MIRLGNGLNYGREKNKLLFDPPRKARRGTVFISHAHSDHARSHPTRTIMTPETAALSGLEAETLPYGQSFRQDECEVIMRSAGHILGSAQFEVCDGSHWVFTGDFKLQDSLLFEGAKPLPCDSLVIETTFGRKQFSFPERWRVYEQMSQWILNNLSSDRIVLLGGYPVGKAQELTRLVNDYCDSPALVHPRIKKVNDTYQENGVGLGDYFSFQSEQGKEIAEDGFVGIIPHHLVSDSLISGIRAEYGREVVPCLATGWTGVFTRYKSFPLSDHADFAQLLEYVLHAEPKNVFTVHGYDSEFARELTRRGFDALPLKNACQKKLDTFL